MPGYLALAAATAMYALGIVAQTIAARRAEPGHGFGLLARLAVDRLYLLGFAGQVGGFVLAFFARAELPLYLVQAGSSCAVGVATVFGVLALGWRVRPVEVAVLVAMALGLLLLAGASAPSVAAEIPVDVGLLVLGGPLLAVFLVSRGAKGVVPVAVAAGLAYAVVAIASRSLADEPVSQLPYYPLVWLMVLAALVGQAGMAVALQRGSATSTIATMDSVTVVVTSAVGILALGDRIAPGREWWVAAGVALVVLGVLALGYASRLTPAPAAQEAA
ncbi:drug/metabolite transporter (DMT)-like permease [Saccharothrix tamanrassetensis]|uniref:Drug/metabolite transporter (DMT)-like permease n=1 Tax=Saccharothrix tamanrassetensis TaxID=1051531 RepID=A0A841CLW9_9PSEU|nr:hypothetical protein [Saccharothrix tamanrassetensis]MBB5957087.1 drug/metabolite transporter (DMT)-like permease [Saccharothrix tamanrassetensis]